MPLSLLVAHVLRQRMRYRRDGLRSRAGAGAEELHDELFTYSRAEALLPHVFLVGTDDSRDPR